MPVPARLSQNLHFRTLPMSSEAKLTRVRHRSHQDWMGNLSLSETEYRFLRLKCIINEGDLGKSSGSGDAPTCRFRPASLHISDTPQHRAFGWLSYHPAFFHTAHYGGQNNCPPKMSTS